MATPKPVFCVQQKKNTEIAVVTNRISLLCKQLLNVFSRWDSNRIFVKNPVRVMI